jgi:hypothetical protein
MMNHGEVGVVHPKSINHQLEKEIKRNMTQK